MTQPHTVSSPSAATTSISVAASVSLVLGVAAACAFVGGLIVLAGVAGLLAVATGVSSRRVLARKPDLRGARLSLAGFLLGAITVILTAPVAVTSLWWILTRG